MQLQRARPHARRGCTTRTVTDASPGDTPWLWTLGARRKGSGVVGSGLVGERAWLTEVLAEFDGTSSGVKVVEVQPDALEDPR